MGGFMRRKNRSLPDLRDGQDSGGETSRSFDDCFFAQTPISIRKKQANTSLIQPINSSAGHKQDISKASQIIKQENKSKKILTRAHTPPPYKPPPPIAHALAPNQPSPKKNAHYFNQDSKKVDKLQVNSLHPEITNKLKNQHHQNGEAKQPLTKQNFHNLHVDSVSRNAEWLKELQLKQEELIQRRKMQEERDKWLSDCFIGAEQKSAGSLRKVDNGKEELNLTQQSFSHEKEQIPNHSIPKSLQMSMADNSSSENDHQKSVRDLTSKFEKINVSPSSDSVVENTVVSYPEVLHSDHNVQSKRTYSDTENKRCQSSANHICSPSVPDKLLAQTDCCNNSAIIHGKEKLNESGGTKQTIQNLANSNVYSHHLTDAQLTNVLRIGGNRSSFRSNTDSQEDPFSQNSREVYILHENKRPDKPPDYETALQRLELMRNDRNFTKFYATNCMNFEDILEQAKKRRVPKKSVTFSDKVVLVACAGDEENDFIPNPLLERVYKQHFMQNPPPVSPPVSHESSQNAKQDASVCESGSSETKTSEVLKSPIPSPCNLCHKKTVESPKLYCPDCSFYMSRFQQK